MSSQIEYAAALALELGREPSAQELRSSVPNMERHFVWLARQFPTYSSSEAVAIVARVEAQAVRRSERELNKNPLRRVAELTATIALVGCSAAFMCFLLWNVAPGRAYGLIAIVTGGVLGWRNTTCKPWDEPTFSDRVGNALVYSYMGLIIACIATGLHYPE